MKSEIISALILHLDLPCLQQGDSGARTAGKSLRPKSVTHVAGTLCSTDLLRTRMLIIAATEVSRAEGPKDKLPVTRPGLSQIEMPHRSRIGFRCYPSVRAFNNSLFISSLPKISISPLAKKNGINTTNTSSTVAKISLGSATVSEKLAAKD